MENTVISASVVIILIAPFLGRNFSMNLVQNPLTRLMLLLFVFYGIRQGPMAGLLSFLAAFSIIIERNHQVLTRFPHQMPKWPSGAGQQGRPQVVAPLLATQETHGYEPPHAEESSTVVERHGESTNEHSYESAGDIQDSNPRLDEVPQGEASGNFYEQKGLVV